MNERYVVSLPMAKRLKEVGFPQDTVFVGVLHHENRWELITSEDFHAHWHGGWETISAPLISEILDNLTNKDILDNCNDNKAMTQGEFMDLFRSPDRLGEIWLEVRK